MISNLGFEAYFTMNSCQDLSNEINRKIDIY